MASITTFKGKRCTAVPKKVNIEQVSTPSSSSSTSTSTSSSSSSTSTSSSILTSASSSSSSASSSSSTSISIPSDPPLPTEAQNPAQADPDSSTQSPSETPSSATSTIPINTPPSQFAEPAVTQTATTPSAIFNTISDNSPLPSTLLIADSSTLTPAQSGDQTQSADGAANDSPTSALLPTDQPGDPAASTNLDGNTAVITGGSSQATNPSSIETDINGATLPGTKQQVTGNAITTEQTIAIAVGVIGGVVAISLIAFIIWLWRKRKMQERRSTMLTPLSPGVTFRGDEKEPYIFSRTSLGPTPLPEKVWAVVGSKFRSLRGRVNNIVARSNSPSPSVNLDRGNSQFGPPDVPYSRSNSPAGGATGGSSTTKGKFVDWWGRLAEDGNFNWRLRQDSKADPIGQDSFTVPRSTNEGSGSKVRSQPDFLTLLNMDDKQLEREITRGRASASGNGRRSISVGNEQHFLGGLGLNLDDPFSDINAIGNNTAKATPMVVSAANNPFSDANAIAAPQRSAGNGGPATYVQNIRRSRGHSVNGVGGGGGGISRQPSNAGARPYSIYRESNASVDTVGTRRNKFRSDPFDLDRPDLLSANNSIDVTSARASKASRGSTSRSIGRFGSIVPIAPLRVHARQESFTSSKYSSGVSMGDWSDPGPDVGPAAARYTPSPDNGVGRRDSDTRRSGGSQGSEGSVGKAL
ncbi:hypothetical protein M434DRAFT_28303 [Hypoxylon sp. CO27-5]|nr:hypothetical protein M434DRAFT_28303 [Hypoxylon sp. CO27-5]